MKSMSVDFAVVEIIDYFYELKNSQRQADECFSHFMEMSDKVERALEEAIEAGNHNLQVCLEEREICQKEKEVAEDKINHLYESVDTLNKDLYELSTRISDATDKYQKACDKAEDLRNKTVSSEAAEAARQQALSAAEAKVAKREQELSRLNDKQSKLTRARDGLEADISALEKICFELDQIDNRLRQEEDKISRAIDLANDLLNKVVQNSKNLEKAHYHFETEIATLSHVVISAEKYANYANDLMGQLNDTGYSNYDRITVDNLNALRDHADDITTTVEHASQYLQSISQTFKEYDYLLQDNIMSQSQIVVDEFIRQDKEIINTLQNKARKLNSFYDSLVRYYKLKL